jgi:PTH1 family peptidyl-tRNA hydrolase
MIIIIGLGNPGKKFEKTRHNLGFLIIENLKLKIENFSDWKYEKKFKAEISRGKIGNKKIILAKPQIFMNNSGKSVKLLVTNYSLPITKLFVIHDDIDLPLGKIKISIGRSAAGHKGVQSIIDELGTKNFVRFRIGIRPNLKFKMQNAKLKFKIQNFVLQKFKKDEEKILEGVIEKTIEAIECSLKLGLEKAMQEYNMMPIYK